jgi:hypothetical protein
VKADLREGSQIRAGRAGETGGARARTERSGRSCRFAHASCCDGEAADLSRFVANIAQAEVARARGAAGEARGGFPRGHPGRVLSRAPRSGLAYDFEQIV